MIIERIIRPASTLVPKDSAGKTEVLDRRTAYSKTYQIQQERGQPDNKFLVLANINRSHYKDDYSDDSEPWKEIDLTIETKDSKEVIEKSPYNMEVWTDKVGYSYRSKKGGRVDVELVEVDGSPVDLSNMTFRKEGNQLFWENVAPDVDIKVVCFPDFAETFKLLKTDSAAKEFKWKISEDVETKARFRHGISGMDDDGRALEIQTELTDPVEQSSSETGNRFKRFYFTERWTGRTSRVLSDRTRQKTWVDGVKFPVMIDASTSEDVADTADDGSAWSTSWFPNRGEIYAGWSTFFGDSARQAGIRYRTLAIPQGATIDSASMQFDKTRIYGSPQLKIYADDVDDAALWSSGNLPQNITKTTASSAWSPANAAGSDTIGITSVLQEVISRPGWSSSNDIRFGVLDQQGGGSHLIGFDDAQAGGNSVHLAVTYTAGGGPTPIAAQRLKSGHGR